LIKVEKSESSRDWTDLNSDILYLIYKNIDDIFDFMRFRAVCKWWNHATPLSDRPLHQFPLLLERNSRLKTKVVLHSPLTGQIHRIETPDAYQRKFLGQSKGYLVTFIPHPYDKNTSPMLFNLFTGALLPLPFSRFRYFRPLHIGSNPMNNADDVVVSMSDSNGYQYVGFRKNTEGKWGVMRNIPFRVDAYHRGRIFFNNIRNYSTSVMDLTTGNQFQVGLPPNRVPGDFFCLGEGADSMLGIQRRYRKRCQYNFVPLTECWFEVYRLDEEQKPPHWVKMSDTEDLLIFLNVDDSGFCLSSSNFRGIKGNCVYFTRWNEGEGDRILIGRNELGKHQSEEIGQVGTQAFWFVPNLQ
jgi:Protein of unknown function (DUF295)